jgi:adenylyl-sulfate kinase
MTLPPNPNNLYPQAQRLSQPERSAIKGHRPAVLWFTGLSGSGKSTLANAIEARLNQVYQAHTYLLDGDHLRTGLNRDLGFSEQARQENIRRAGELARLFFDAGLIVLTAFISPFREDRDRIRSLLLPGGFIEIYTSCPLEVCEQRDPKGIYQKARAGQISNFTGIDSPYEAPFQPEITLDTSASTPEDAAQAVINYLTAYRIIKRIA